MDREDFMKLTRPFMVGLFALAGLVGGLLLAGVFTHQATAAPYSSERNIYDLLERLNGTPVRIGVLTVADAGVATRTLTAWKQHMLQCDAPAHMGGGTTCSGQYTNANACQWFNANQTFYLTPTYESDSGVAMTPADGGAAANCTVYQMH